MDEPDLSPVDVSRAEPVPPELVRGNPAMWGLVLLVLVGLAIAALAIVRGVERGPRPPFLVQPPVSPASEQFQHDPNVLHVAGSGSNLPLTRALAEAFSDADPEAHVVIHQSIGSTGGVRAVHDGAVDLGLVSRDLRPRERDLGLRQVPYARVAVVFGADRRVEVSDVSSEEVLAMYRGDRPTWPDGTPMVVLQREEGDSSHLVAREAIEGFRAVDDQALDEGRWRVLYSDRAMRDALISTSGGVGLIDFGAAVAEELPVRVLSLDGIRPSPTTVEDGSYPMTKSLSFVLTADLSERARAFVDFVFSPRGQQVIREHGYSPVPREDR